MTTKSEVLRELQNGEGCLGKAAGAEPVFVLRAQDMFAPAIVERWAALVEGQNKPASKHKIAEARAIAHEMRAWQCRNTQKIPD
jgi:hypothetical protein